MIDSVTLVATVLIVAVEIIAALIPVYYLHRVRRMKDTNDFTESMPNQERKKRKKFFLSVCFLSVCFIVFLIIVFSFAGQTLFSFYHVAASPPLSEANSALDYVTSIVSLYAGNDKQEIVDGPLLKGSFLSPERMHCEDNSLYVCDAGRVRVLQDNRILTLPLMNSYQADIVRSWNHKAYILLKPSFQADGTLQSCLLCADGESVTTVFTFENGSKNLMIRKITDFAFSSDGTLWYIEQAQMKDSYFVLCRCSADTEGNFHNPEWVMDLQWNVSESNSPRMAFDNADNLYISLPEDGVILRIEEGAEVFSIFAGDAGKLTPKDGVSPTFACPISLATDNNYLYVLDSGLVRRISLSPTTSPKTQTLAGTLGSNENERIPLGRGSQAVLPSSEKSSIAVDSAGTVFVSDPDNSAIYRIDS